MSEIVTGSIEAVRKDGAGFKLDDDQWYSLPRGNTTSTEGYECHRGDTVKLMVTRNGKWNNIDNGKFKVTSSEPAPTAAGGSTTKGGPAAKRWHLYEDAEFQQETAARIARSTALAQAVALCKGTDAEGEDAVVAVATKFAAFLLGADMPEDEGVEPTPAADFDDETF